MLSNSFRIVIISALLCLSLSPAHAAIKCWKNRDGIRECGNTIPPEYAQQGHQELNKHGVTMEKAKRAKTREELDRQDQLAALERQKRLILEKQQASDQLLLRSFASADDIILAKQGKLSALKAEIQLRESHIDKLQTNLDKLTTSAADMERRGEKPTEKLLNDITNVKAQIVENERYILSKREEEEKVAEKYDEDLMRYKRLQAAR